MKKLRAGGRARLKDSQTGELSQEIYFVHNNDIKGRGRLAEIKEPARLVLLLDMNTMTSFLAYYVECEPVD